MDLSFLLSPEDDVDLAADKKRRRQIKDSMAAERTLDVSFLMTAENEADAAADDREKLRRDLSKSLRRTDEMEQASMPLMSKKILRERREDHTENITYHRPESMGNHVEFIFPQGVFPSASKLRFYVELQPEFKTSPSSPISRFRCSFLLRRLDIAKTVELGSVGVRYNDDHEHLEGDGFYNFSTMYPPPIEPWRRSSRRGTR